MPKSATRNNRNKKKNNNTGIELAPLGATRRRSSSANTNNSNNSGFGSPRNNVGGLRIKIPRSNVNQTKHNTSDFAAVYHKFRSYPSFFYQLQEMPTDVYKELQRQFEDSLYELKTIPRPPVSVASPNKFTFYRVVVPKKDSIDKRDYPIKTFLKISDEGRLKKNLDRHAHNDHTFATQLAHFDMLGYKVKVSGIFKKTYTLVEKD